MWCGWKRVRPNTAGQWPGAGYTDLNMRVIGAHWRGVPCSPVRKTSLSWCSILRELSLLLPRKRVLPKLSMALCFWLVMCPSPPSAAPQPGGTSRAGSSYWISGARRRLLSGSCWRWSRPWPWWETRWWWLRCAWWRNFGNLQTTFWCPLRWRTCQWP